MAAYITNRMRRHFYPASTLVLPGNPLFRKPTSNTTAMATRLVFVDGLGRPRLIAEAFLHEGGDIHLCLRVLDRQAIPRLVATLLLHRVEALRRGNERTQLRPWPVDTERRGGYDQSAALEKRVRSADVDSVDGEDESPFLRQFVRHVGLVGVGERGRGEG
jgi:hypothetical protein